MDDVVIYGAGGLGELVQDILLQAGRYRPAAFLDSDPAQQGRNVFGLTVKGGAEQIEGLRRDGVSRMIVAVGDNPARVALAESLKSRGFELVSAIHPLASISPSAQIGAHVIIGPRATICVHARIGAHTVLSAGAIAEHDNIIGKGVYLGPAVRLAGGVTIGDLANVAIGATVIPGCNVGAGARVEAGAVVIKDVPADVTAGGVPATAGKVLESRFVPAGA